ncbi:hypothetical protein KC980_01025 [candidate division WWE3 bacterium]|uniref:Uncharacterized protein n=1 Tax=candidate division WWE3 bacterium TaxID=2053526 RepID=A0A955EC96_UNCKA|nr:hypothetical protein [candidate division WWE3 bacterium]
MSFSKHPSWESSADLSPEYNVHSEIESFKAYVAVEVNPNPTRHYARATQHNCTFVNTPPDELPFLHPDDHQKLIGFDDTHFNNLTGAETYNQWLCYKEDRKAPDTYYTHFALVPSADDAGSPKLEVIRVAPTVGEETPLDLYTTKVPFGSVILTRSDKGVWHYAGTKFISR